MAPFGPVFSGACPGVCSRCGGHFAALKVQAFDENPHPWKPFTSKREGGSWAVFAWFTVRLKREVSLIRSLSLSLLLLLAWFISAPVIDASPALAPVTYHVATNGSDSDPGTDSKPFRTIQKAVNMARPGDSILVHAGVYREAVEIRQSGTAAARIQLTSAGSDKAIIQPTLGRRSCSQTSPARDRAIEVLYGTDYWTISNLVIDGGVLISGNNIRNLDRHIKDRRLPGRSSYDPSASGRLLESVGVNGADYIQLVGNEITGRGVMTMAARYGWIKSNEIHDIDCGTGAAVWINRFSDGWQITDNYIHDMGASDQHYMEEGIRQGSGSSYNVVANNLIENLAGRGRGITTDVYASWNLIQGNTVRRADQGFNEQYGGWGNQWVGNLAESNRKHGINIYGQGGKLTSPNEGVPALTQVRCNVSRNNGDHNMHIGAVQQGTFKTNAVGDVWVSPRLEEYWKRVGDTWDGSSSPPPENPPARFC
jgi:hypothetical protein